MNEQKFFSSFRKSNSSYNLTRGCLIFAISMGNQLGVYLRERLICKSNFIDDGLFKGGYGNNVYLLREELVAILFSQYNAI